MAQKTFELKIVTVGKILFDGDALEFHCTGADGELSVLAHHEPYITTIREGVLRVTAPHGDLQEFEVAGGVLEVAENKTLALCYIDA